MIMANTNVEIFDNEFYDNGTTNVLLVSYLSNQKQINDPNYYPYAELINVHSNKMGRSGYLPDGPIKELLITVVGMPLPDVIWDGVANPAKMQDGKLSEDAGIFIHNNVKSSDGEVTMVSLGGLVVAENPATVKLERDPAAFAGNPAPIAPVKLSGIN